MSSENMAHISLAGRIHGAAMLLLRDAMARLQPWPAAFFILSLCLLSAVGSYAGARLLIWHHVQQIATITDRSATRLALRADAEAIFSQRGQAGMLMEQPTVGALVEQVAMRLPPGAQLVSLRFDARRGMEIEMVMDDPAGSVPGFADHPLLARLRPGSQSNEPDGRWRIRMTTVQP